MTTLCLYPQSYKWFTHKTTITRFKIMYRSDRHNMHNAVFSCFYLEQSVADTSPHTQWSMLEDKNTPDNGIDEASPIFTDHHIQQRYLPLFTHTNPLVIDSAVCHELLKMLKYTWRVSSQNELSAIFFKKGHNRIILKNVFRKKPSLLCINLDFWSYDQKYRKGTSIRQAPVFRHLRAFRKSPWKFIIWMNEL